ncbi:dienelactone hydrolase [Histoplasma capsulatum]|uniref:Dienelactone hydrolase n=1 Tax=Ajellomyces capsulatus TaxID=5037 RepID=A0A8A1M296_AJECA|nr:dienelactone hydrolase [Histoplasma capsulatum]
MASHPPSACCTRGFKHQGIASGEIKKIGDISFTSELDYVTRFLKEGGGLDVGYVAHPYFVAAEELLAIKGPYAISAAQTDSVFPSNLRHDTEELLIKVGLPWQITLFSGTEHGFSVRGDLSNKAVRFAKEQAFVQAVTWFGEHL